MKDSLKILYGKDKVLANKIANILGYKIISKKVPKLKQSIQKKINKELGNLVTPHDKTKYFKSIPIDDIFDILDKYDVIPLQEDNTRWIGMLLGPEGKTNIRLAPKSTVNAQDMYTPYGNTMLILTWYKIEPTNKFEVVTYLS